jgi:succinate dehydrogenase hydrophobic anchor subunit
MARIIIGDIIELLFDVRVPLWLIVILLFIMIPNKTKTYRRWRGNLWRNLVTKPFYKVKSWLIRS